jgi:hypothetical protein
MAQVEAKIQMNLNLYKLLGICRDCYSIYRRAKNMTAKSTLRMSDQSVQSYLDG